MTTHFWLVLPPPLWRGALDTTPGDVRVGRLTRNAFDDTCELIAASLRPAGVAERGAAFGPLDDLLLVRRAGGGGGGAAGLLAGFTPTPRQLVAAVYGTFTEGFTTPDLVDAAALLKALA
jgi:hypothetical protein